MTRSPGIRSWRSGPESSEREGSFPALGSETLKSRLGSSCYQASFPVREAAVLWLEASGENHLMVAALPGQHRRPAGMGYLVPRCGRCRSCEGEAVRPSDLGPGVAPTIRTPRKRIR